MALGKISLEKGGATLFGLRNVVVQLLIFVMYRCTVCGATLFGLRNVVVHYEGKKHKAKLVEEEVPKKISIKY